MIQVLQTFAKPATLKSPTRGCQPCHVGARQTRQMCFLLDGPEDNDGYDFKCDE